MSYTAFGIRHPASGIRHPAHLANVALGDVADTRQVFALGEPHRRRRTAVSGSVTESKIREVNRMPNAEYRARANQSITKIRPKPPLDLPHRGSLTGRIIFKLVAADFADAEVFCLGMIEIQPAH